MKVNLFLIGFLLAMAGDFRIAAAEMDIEKLKAMAETGDAKAQLRVGLAYGTGKGVTLDYQEAARWYRKAAEQGNAAAQFLLGDTYQQGLGVAPDYPEAYAWLHLASMDGDKRHLTARDAVRKKLTSGQLTEGQKKADEYSLKIDQLKKESAGK